ncbi:MAG: S8 family serine peptidase [Pirellulales bacterium]
MRDGSRREGFFRTTGIETFEDRRLMAADTSAYDYHLDYQIAAKLEGKGIRIGQLAQSTSAAHTMTGLTNVVNKYGLTGAGQTVAVIDSGIAYDHLALGGGYGANYRVVGGWDFAENDANPYDDGPAGSHGTHVAGIVGGSDTGVANGVDLVSLRVFDDQGSGNFTWVENALKWVHQNRNAFENPITTVNLSIGAGWNSSSLPNWAMLEDELRQLEADGIFVSVAAGNSFGSYGTVGLDYPAVSSYVVPVMSVNAAGTLSSFSQRLALAIAAPGEGIRSTVPDYMGNLNGRADDYQNFSGTSMAAPYVAGASTLIREAMQIAGRTNITQDVIYDVMMNTADTFYDSVTRLSYKRLNVERAIDSIIPADEFGNTISTASVQNALGRGGSISGIVNTVTDKDYFTFTATASGNLGLASTTNGDLAMRYELVSSSGTTTINASTATLNVVAGQTYTIGVSTRAGIGRYTLSTTFTASANSGTSSGSTAPGTGSGNAQSGQGDQTNQGSQNGQNGQSNQGNIGTAFNPPNTTQNFGTVSQYAANVNVAGTGWYALSSSRAGTLTIESFINGNAAAKVTIYDATGNILGSFAAGVNNRVDLQVAAGKTFYVKIEGNATNFGLRMTNLVSQSGTTLNVAGTVGNDTIVVQSATRNVTVNGVVYAVSPNAVNRINVNGAGGSDSITIRGSAGAETVTMTPTATVMNGSGIIVAADGFRNVTVVGQGGDDVATLVDSAGNDTLTARPREIAFVGTNFNNTVLDIRKSQHRCVRRRNRRRHVLRFDRQRYVFQPTRICVYDRWGIPKLRNGL